MSFADDDQDMAEVDDLQKLQFRKDSKHHDTMVVSSSKNPDYEKERKKEQPSVKVNQGKGCDPFSDSQSLPIVAEKLLTYIEENGLYVEDIYLKFADKKKIEELRQRLDRDIEAVDLMVYSIHVVCNVFILWLKYLPNPIIPVRFYKRFVRAMGLQHWRERVRMVYSLINQLPSCNLNTLERIILHLVRIAQKERTNYMTPKMLSIVFGRCLLQCKNKDKPETVQEIGRTIACIELIIWEQLKYFPIPLKEISNFEYMQYKMNQRFSLTNFCMCRRRQEWKSYPLPDTPGPSFSYMADDPWATHYPSPSYSLVLKEPEKEENGAAKTNPVKMADQPSKEIQNTASRTKAPLQPHQDMPLVST